MSIFVQIASFRDPECHHTVSDLFAKAANPDRISVGICWQYHPDEDAAMIAVPYPRPEQVRVVQFHVDDARGAGWARGQAQTLWQGEDYVLQIQAHHRFEPGWDDTLIALLEGLPTKKAVLTAWLPGYTPPRTLKKQANQLPVATINRIGDIDDPQVIHLIGVNRPQKAITAPFLTGLWVGNFMFARAEVLQDVPPDPHIYFWGEELNYSARLWTHGYDLYHLDRVVLYHYWDRKDVKSEALYRGKQATRNQRSLARNLHVLGLNPAQDDAVLEDIEPYGLGTARPIWDYFSFIGVDLTRGTVEMFARIGTFENPLARDPDITARGAKKIFVAIASYRDPETQHTVADMFANALYPDRIFAGICHQLELPQDEGCRFTPARPAQVRMELLPASESRGANWARVRAMELYNGEDYILVIDSHMRFQYGWDELLLSALARCPASDVLLSAYAPGYTPPNRRDFAPYHPLRLCVRRFGNERDPQLVHLTGVHASKAGEQGGLYPSPFLSANFMFAAADVWARVPIDPFIPFYGDEISLAIRLWTHGIDIYQPDGMILYHYWTRAAQPYRNVENAAAQASRRRVRYLIGLEVAEDKAALNGLDKYGLGDKRNITDFWEFSGIDPVSGFISDEAKNGQWNITTMAKAKNKPARPRIFVQIASYRDPECQRTVKNLFDQATHPERISVGICWQYIKEEDAICFETPYPYPQQVRVHEVDAREGKGACWARSLTQALWKGEEFTLQIDSHMRFEKGWDELLLSMYDKVGGGKSVLTCYPPGFTPPDTLQKDFFFSMAGKEFDSNGIFKMTGSPAFRTNQPPPQQPMLGAFASACMFFGPSSIIEDVPYDPNLYFFGEEITLAARFWTHGYNIYHPNGIVVYHDWDRSKRPTHFTDHPKTWKVKDDASVARVRHIMGTEITTDPLLLVDLDKYGLGTVRTLAEYEEYSGVDFAKKIISHKAANALFKPYVATAGKTQQNGERIFVRIASYRDPECQWTIKDLFEKATFPDRISVGVCWQFDEKEDAHCFEVTTRPEQVRVFPVDWRESEGVCWARAQTELLWEGEEYSLQIDSHMRFAPGWDVKIIEELAACPSEKPIISCSPAKYTPPHNLEEKPLPNVHCIGKPFSPQGNVRGRGELMEIESDVPLPGAFVAAGLVFSRSDVMREVPYDPYLYFDQEEIVYAMRLYTHGWDLFNTRSSFIYHYYNVGHVSGRPLHWSDMKSVAHDEKYRSLSSRGLSRFNHLSRHKIITDEKLLVDIEKYGLGTARSLEQYEEYSGIDLRNKIVHPKAHQAGFVPNLSKYRKRPIPLPTDAPPTTPTQAQQPYDAGDMMPHFMAQETTGKQRAFQSFLGKPTVLFLIRFDDANGNKPFFEALDAAMKEAGNPDINLVFMVDSTIERLVEYRKSNAIEPHLLADNDVRIGMALGITSAPCAFLLAPNLQIKTKHSGMTSAELAPMMLGEVKEYLAAQKKQKPKLVTENAPVLLMHDVFTPEFCAGLISAYERGAKIQGQVGDKGYDPNSKLRSDFVMPDELRRKIDRKLSHSLFHEIEKIFGFKVAARENYKIGMYSGEEGGFFAAHRDNYDAPRGHRRVAVTINLSDDYEGGGLYFPEYDPNHVYKTKAGGLVAFSASMLHEAVKVSKGKRYVLVCFFHGEEEELFRQHYARVHGLPLEVAEFKPDADMISGAMRSRDFYRQWQHDQKTTPPPIPTPAPVVHVITPPPVVAAPVIATAAMQYTRPIVAVGRAKHVPVKVYESRGGVVFDNFLPDDLYNRLQNYCLTTDYEHINTKGKISRAWHVHDGFPLRSMMNAFYYADPSLLPMPKPSYAHPTGTGFDEFLQFMVDFQPQVEFYTGKRKDGWAHFSATSWLYPPGTGLAMHDDGSGVYTGAYAFFLNRTWRAHWGGMLILMDDAANDVVHAHRKTIDQVEYHKQKWLHTNNIDELMLEQGLGRCIFPKGNRMVFIANDAYHMVTRVNETAGDNLRLSVAGFFDRKKHT